MREQVRVGRAAPGLALQSSARLNRLCLAALKAALLTLLAVLLFFQFQSRRFVALTSTAAMDNAQVARSLAAGMGPYSLVLRPIELRQGKVGSQHIDRLNAPLYIAVLAGVFRLRDPDDLAVASTNGLLHLLSALLFYFCARRLLGSRAAVLGTVLFVASVSLIGAALDGSGLSLALLLLLGAVYAALQVHPPEDPAQQESRLISPRWVLGWLVVCGVLFGLAFLAGHVSLLLVAPIAWLATRGQRRDVTDVTNEQERRPRSGLRHRLVRSALVVLPALVVIVAGLVAFRGLPVRQALLPTLRRYMLVFNTQSYPGASILTMAPEAGVGPFDFVRTQAKQMLLKAARGTVNVYSALPTTWGAYLLPFVLLGGISFGRASVKWRLWGTLLVMVLLQGVTIALYSWDTDDLVVLLPVALLLGTGALWWVLAEHIQRWPARLVVGTLVMGLLMFPYLASAGLGGKVVKPMHGSAQTMQRLIGLLGMPPDAVIATDMPEALAWWGGRRAVQLPPDYDALRSLEERGARAGAIFLSAGLADAPAEARMDYWKRYLSLNPGPDAGALVVDPEKEQVKRVALSEVNLQKQGIVAVDWQTRLPYGDPNAPQTQVARVIKLARTGDVLLALPAPEKGKATAPSGVSG